MPPADLGEIRALAQKDLEDGNLAAAAARLEAADAANPDVQFDLCRLYFKTGDWDRVDAAARTALKTERSVEDTFQLLSAIVTAAHKLGRNEALRDESPGLLGKLSNAIARSYPNLDVESHAGLKVWQMAAAVAFGCNDTAAALELYRQRSAASCPLAANATSVTVSKVSTLARWCETSGSRYTVVEPPQRITIQGPDPRGRSYETGVFAVAVVPGGEFVSGWDFVRAPSGEVLEDSGYVGLETNYQSFSPHTFFKGLGLVGHLWPTERTHIDQDALFLSTPERFHVGHWIVDFLPRLRALDILGAKDMALAVPTELSRKQTDLLGLFGIDSSRLIKCDLGKRYSFRSLAVAKIGAPHCPNPETVKFMGAAMRLPTAVTSRPRRLFLGRGTGTRLIVNQSEIDLELEAFGFEHVDLAKMTIAEQRTTIGGAEVVACVLGSDVLSCFFMRPGSHLVELNWDPAEDAAAGPYCAMLGVHHHPFLGEAAATTQMKVMKKDRDFRIDRAALRRLLESLAAPRPA